MGAFATVETLRIIVSEALELRLDDVSENSAFRDLGATSLDIAEILASVEDAFGVHVSDADLIALSTVGDVAAKIDRILAVNS